MKSPLPKKNPQCKINFKARTKISEKKLLFKEENPFLPNDTNNSFKNHRIELLGYSYEKDFSTT